MSIVRTSRAARAVALALVSLAAAATPAHASASSCRADINGALDATRQAIDADEAGDTGAALGSNTQTTLKIASTLVSCLGQRLPVMQNLVKAIPKNLDASSSNLRGDAFGAKVKEHELVPYLVYALWGVA